MKNPKAGDRVAIYEHSARVLGCISKVLSVNQCMITTDKGDQFAVHVKQLRRLVPKKRREFWIPKEWNSANIALLREQGNEWLSLTPPDNSSRSRFIRVREVKP